MSTLSGHPIIFNSLPRDLVPPVETNKLRQIKVSMKLTMLIECEPIGLSFEDDLRQQCSALDYLALTPCHPKIWKEYSKSLQMSSPWRSLKGPWYSGKLVSLHFSPGSLIMKKLQKLVDLGLTENMVSCHSKPLQFSAFCFHKCYYFRVQVQTRQAFESLSMVLLQVL